MRKILSIASVVCLVIPVWAWEPSVVDTIELYWPNGHLKERWFIKTFTEGCDSCTPFKEGDYCSWYENGQLECQGRYERGRASGWWINFFPNGKRKEEGLYQGGEKTGAWITWSENGQRLSEVNYSRGVKHGRCIKWCDLNPWCTEEDLNFRNGKLHGLCRWRGNDDQSAKRAFYLDGRLLITDDPVEYWHFKCRADGQYYNNEYNILIEWLENCRTFITTEYMDGRNHGRRTTWSASGEIIKVEIYKDGQVIE